MPSYERGNGPTINETTTPESAKPKKSRITEAGELRRLQGIAQAKAAGIYKGRQNSEDLHVRAKLGLRWGISVRKLAVLCDCAKSTVQRIQASQAQD